ncbi:membrane-anchored junction protein-like isoform X2 [Rissa tridactyla]|uniref:membrane-anchored junction protein-like isoform X2 n=1 Tax=Rissa tridactyla TaxID=75485 RepID=UPI0023BAB789|nr:membrane-anchored junction protein-like isoform X2 [Rissa tridactyla]
MSLKPFTYPLPETRFLHAGGLVYKFKIRYGNFSSAPDLNAGSAVKELEEAIRVILGNLDDLHPLLGKGGAETSKPGCFPGELFPLFSLASRQGWKSQTLPAAGGTGAVLVALVALEPDAPGCCSQRDGGRELLGERSRDGKRRLRFSS